MVIITGDSWGVAEFAKYNQRLKTDGPGIAQQLQHCVDVTNLSRGGGSNKRSLYKLEQFLKRYTPLPQDRFIWIVTSPDRCVEDVEQFIANTESIYQAMVTKLNNSLEQANSIAKENNIVIEAVGGVCDLVHIDREYSNLKIAVPSWGQLLSNNYSTSIIDPIFLTTIGPIIKNKFPDKLNQWIELASIAEQKYLSWESMKGTFFKTDGTHPDRDGHYVLLCKLFPTLTEYYEYENTIQSH